MPSRSLRVEFISAQTSALEVTSPPEVHDVSIPDGVVGTPQVLDNPHVDFPGTWVLQGEGEGGTYRYARASETPSTSGTAVG